MIKRTYFTLEDANIDLNELINQDETSTKLAQLIDFRFGDCWVVYKDISVNPWDLNTDIDVLAPDATSVNRWKKKFKYIYGTTVDKYSRIIELYKDNEAKLMDSIKIETTTSGSNTGTHSNKDTGNDTALHTGTNTDTNNDIKNAESGTDSITVAKTGTDTETDTRTVTNSGTDKTTNTDNSSVTLSGTDTVSGNARKVVNDTPQTDAGDLDSDKYASLIEKQTNSNSTNYGKTETHSGGTTSSVENGLKQTHGGDLKHNYNTTDTTTNTYGHTSTLSGSLTHEFNETNKNTYEHNVAGENKQITSGSTVTVDDRQSVIDRLHNIHKSYDQLYKEWVKEFTPLFGESTII